MDDLRLLLQNASAADCANLATILNASDTTPDALIEGLQWNAHHQLHYYLGWRKSYIDVVRQVADHLQVSYTPDATVDHIEAEIVSKSLPQLLEQMTPEQRAALEEEWKQVAQQFDKWGSVAVDISAVVILSAAQLSGFGIYLGASTLVGALTSAIGVTLPFAFYTGMSSIIAVLIGPVGWIGLGLISIWKLDDPNYNRLMPAVLYICTLRTKQRCAMEIVEYRCLEH
jgi:uncharacterized protein YaaW (UPF0174 family)